MASVDNAFAIAEHLSFCPTWRLAPGTCLSSVYRELRIRCWRLDQSWFLINDVVNCLSSDFTPMIQQLRFATLRWHEASVYPLCWTVLDVLAVCHGAQLVPGRQFLTYGFLARSGLWASLRQLYRYIDGVCVLTQNRRSSVQSLGLLV